MRVRTMHPSNARCSVLRAVPTNKQTNKKHHIFAPTAGARCTIFPKLCMVIELVVPIKIGVIHFSIQRMVFPTGCTKNLAQFTDARFLRNNSVTCEANHMKFESLTSDNIQISCIKAPKNFRNRSRESPLRVHSLPKSGNF